ncbi:hypothetical protein RB614_35750, partial [Phytohabitans sp. ZYX-F-186]|nr:hypothetical protein [Phytohabitans sp. ZYX-F-186]
MSTSRIEPAEAERLLDAGRDPAHPGLSRLLAAATAPPRPEELAGLPRAVAAFVEAGRASRPGAAEPAGRAARRRQATRRRPHGLRPLV